MTFQRQLRKNRAKKEQAEKLDHSLEGPVRLLILETRPAADKSMLVQLSQQLHQLGAAKVHVTRCRVQSKEEALAAVEECQPRTILLDGEISASQRLYFISPEGGRTHWCQLANLLAGFVTKKRTYPLIVINGPVIGNEAMLATKHRVAALMGWKTADSVAVEGFWLPFYMALCFGNSIGEAFNKLKGIVPLGALQLYFPLDKNLHQVYLRRSPARMAAQRQAANRRIKEGLKQQLASMLPTQPAQPLQQS